MAYCYYEVIKREIINIIWVEKLLNQISDSCSLSGGWYKSGEV